MKSRYLILFWNVTLSTRKVSRLQPNVNVAFHFWSYSVEPRNAIHQNSRLVDIFVHVNDWTCKIVESPTMQWWKNFGWPNIPLMRGSTLQKMEGHAKTHTCSEGQIGKTRSLCIFKGKNVPTFGLVAFNENCSFY